MINTTGEYALRAAVFIAQHHDRPQTTQVIAEGTLVPSDYLSKILQSMVRAELLSSRRGVNGGFKLMRPPRDISVLDVLTSVNAEPKRIERCPLGIEGHMKLCPLHKLVDDSVEHAHAAFAKASLDALSKSAGDVQALCNR